ncbi:acyltransferase [Ochrobactrum sp. CGA5]|uniref:acyltransferase family protein n=1 Tax=Ochrobactrum sp. CGA5 TaxID=2583453 RepID=UPI00112414EE|nr:acyltransferase [Ochrobactrum sp. CGA5]
MKFRNNSNEGFYMSAGGAFKTRIKGFDGLRTIAVIAVFIHHTGLIPLHGGFIGVDIFFVLSGFLITSILVNERISTGYIDLFRFYIRRTGRLFPALLFFLVLISIYILAFKPAVSLSFEILPPLGYFMNWVRAFDIYDAKLTGHTWTLAVEEQFYIIWPLVILAIWRVKFLKPIVVMLSLAIAAVLWRSYMVGSGAPPARIYTGLDTHADGLVFGAAIAVLPRSILFLIGKWLWMPAAAYICYVLTSNSATAFASYNIGFTVTALASVAVIAKIFSDQGSLVTKSLDFLPMRWFGRLSYGFYLWHYPVIKILLYSGYQEFGMFFGTSIYPKITMFAACFGVSLLLTVISWYFIESPVQKKVHLWLQNYEAEKNQNDSALMMENPKMTAPVWPGRRKAHD